MEPQDPTLPTLVHFLIHGVLVCSCEAHLVLVMPVGAETECSSCKRKWRLESLDYSIIKSAEGAESGQLHFKIKETTVIAAPPGPRLILPGNFKH